MSNENSEIRGDGSSLSIEETNKIRIQLGLKPLVCDDSNTETESSTKKADVHVPAKNIGAEKSKDKIIKKIQAHKEDRELREKLAQEKSLGEGDSISTIDFINRIANKKAENDAKMKSHDEEDENDEESNELNYNDKMYQSNDLSGIQIEHKAKRFDNFVPIILTLKDSNILDKNSDALVNVNIVDEERAEKNIRNKKMGAYGSYIDSDDEDDPLSTFKPVKILPKYDEVIDGEKRDKFILDSRGKYGMEQEKAEDEFRKSIVTGTLQVLHDNTKVASDFLTRDEIKLITRKRKARSVRTGQPKSKKDKPVETEGTKSKKEDGELAEEETGKKSTTQEKVYQHSTMNFSSDEEDFRPSLIMAELESTVINVELKRKIDLLKKAKPKVEGFMKMEIDEVKLESNQKTDSESRKLILSNTEEYTKSLYNTLQMKRKMDSEAAAQVKEEPIIKQAPIVAKKIEIKEEEEEPVQSSGWQPEEKILSQSVQAPKRKVNYREAPVVPQKKELKLTDGILGDDVILNAGIYTTLLLAKNKGYLEEKKSQTLISNPKNKMLNAQHYQEEKIRYDDIDQKCPRRERRNVPETQFVDRTDFVPEIKLEYHDELGRVQPPKEAFRALSHRFHGKTSGKIKSAKRLKKIEEQAKISSMGDSEQKVIKMHNKMKSESRYCVPLSGKNSIIPAALKKNEKK